ncbi:hypothetical protein HBZC1_02590 [Helicobacter bizzozeronii CIII-1]|uniref:Uncharacterized protein n=1 Tax=Helicobacter bizzozeronii (strain CIII-1) TaxID=1002804 RepID=F8KR71_HELBC|nr:hypothetical protein [Helicobacter bizzozeronii]CCB79245.1 hypothetical protein HBZC1_02590 [Helicobacter bizzozeronii CIII-1]
MKLAKFALTCDGEKITSLEQLKEHFNLLDVLEHYKTNTLWRWLRSRGYESELQGIEAITATQDTEILKALCEVFGIEADQQMIQEVLEDRKNMEEKEASKAEFKTQHALVPLNTPKALTTLPALNAHSTPHAPNFKDYLKSYTTLKNKLFNAKNLEEGKDALRELIQDYAELLEMDKYNIVAVLHTKAKLHPTIKIPTKYGPIEHYGAETKPAFAPFLWLFFLVNLWGLEWDKYPYQMYDLESRDYEFRDRILQDKVKAQDFYNLFCADSNYCLGYYQLDYVFTHIAKPETLTIPAGGKVHVFDKIVLVPREQKNEKDKVYYGINPYDLETNLAIKAEDTPQNFAYLSSYTFYLCKGAVEIRHSNETRQNITLSYIEIEL